MSLDKMQIAKRKEKTIHDENNQIIRDIKISSHPSPSYLLEKFNCTKIIVKSNSQAAEKCANGDVDACITTELSRKIYNLETVFHFGSPDMIFFVGISKRGAEVVDRIFHENKVEG